MYFSLVFNKATLATSTTEICRPIEVGSAAYFKRGLSKDTTAYIVFVEQVSDKVDYRYTHRAAHRSAAKEETCAKSNRLLDELKRDYPTVFSEPTYPMQKHRTPFSILLIDESVQPEQRQLYPLSESKLVELQKQIKVLTDSGRIVPNSSPYGHPIIFAEIKGRAGLRMCMDYRTLNSNAITDAWPLPRIDELLGRLRGAKVLSKLDLRDGYYQILVELKDHYKMAFACRYGSYEFTVMQFGFKNAPSHFQRQIMMLLSNLVDKCIVVYLDDILIFSKHRTEHEAHVWEVFNRLLNKKFYLKCEKCDMYLDEVEFLGHLVSSPGVKVVPNKICAVKEQPQPICEREVQAFLGLANYYQRFTKKFAAVAQPLTDLMCKGHEFLWTTKYTEAFNLLKDKLVNTPILQVYDPEREQELCVDAFDLACGGVLVQKGDDGKWLPIEYMFHHLSAAESNYSATECELLAIMLGLKRWRHFLLGKQFKVKTDHTSLCFLMSQPSLSRRQARWFDFFSLFDIVIEHVPSHDNQVPDALSRQTVNATILTSDSDLLEKIHRA